MNALLVQVLMQLTSALTILTHERDALAATLAMLHGDVERLHDEVAALRGQVAHRVTAVTAMSCPLYPSLTSETREHVDTACAAYHLGRKAQPLRAWACYENGPLRPVRIHGRSAWAVAEPRRIGNRSLRLGYGREP
jgi:hypothetical protein